MNGKFKVWDKIKSCWSARDFAVLKSGQLMIWDTNMSWSDSQINERFTTVYSTGRTDKSGIEIYEGDILIKGHVVSQIEDCWAGSKYGSAGTILGRLHPDLLKVIGNKFENPELLEANLKIDKIHPTMV